MRIGYRYAMAYKLYFQNGHYMFYFLVDVVYSAVKVPSFIQVMRVSLSNENMVGCSDAQLVSTPKVHIPIIPAWFISVRQCWS